MSSAGDGYRVYPHLYSAEDYGVPQRRRRILIVGIRDDLNVDFVPPAPTCQNPVTVRQALIENPVPASASNNELTRQSLAVIERLKHIRPGENAFTATMPDELRLNVVGAKISQIYRRLDPEKPAYTITGSGGGGTHVYHWEENRALTNRERARLQSFPDDFHFSGSKESVRKQIGMAVPPLLAKAVFEAIVRTLKNTPYPSVVQNIAFDAIKVKKDSRQHSFAYEEEVAYR
jgi:DNA (cytosine-5)-methyltransferase 1